MTLDDLLRWLLLAALGLAVCAAAGRTVGWLFARERPPRQPPAYDPISLPPAGDELTRLLPVRFVGRAPVRPRPTLPSLALLVDFIAVEAAVRHALEWETPHAPIWAEIHGRRHVQGLAVV